MDLDVKRWDVISTKVRRYPYLLDWTCSSTRILSIRLELLVRLVIGLLEDAKCKNAIIR